MKNLLKLMQWALMFYGAYTVLKELDLIGKIMDFVKDLFKKSPMSPRPAENKKDLLTKTN